MYAAQALNYVFPLLVLPILARRLGVAPFGELVFAQAAALYAVILAEYGYNFTATREIAASASHAAQVARVFWTTMVARIALAALGIALTLAVVAVVSTSPHTTPLVAACLVQALGAALMPTWFLQGLERFFSLALAQAAGRVTSMVLLLVLVDSGDDVLLAALSIASAPLVSAAVALAAVRLQGGVEVYRLRLADVLASLRKGSHMFQANLAGSLYLNTNVLILGWVAGSYVVGLYGFGSRVVTALAGLFAPIAQVALPRLAAIGATGDAGDFARLARPFAIAIIGLGAAGTCGLALVPELVARLVGGERFVDASFMLLVMSPLPLVLAVSTVFAHIVLIGFGLFDPLRRIYWLMAATSLVCIAPAAIVGRSAGAAYVWMAVEILGLVLMYGRLRRIDHLLLTRMLRGGASAR